MDQTRPLAPIDRPPPLPTEPALFNPQCACGAHLFSPDAVPTLSWASTSPHLADEPSIVERWSGIWRVLLPMRTNRPPSPPRRGVSRTSSRSS